MPMLFYVPPMLPVMASVSATDHSEQAKKKGDIAKHWDDSWLYDTSTEDLWGTIDEARFPIKYMASLFGAGDPEKVKGPLKKMMAVRIHRRAETVGDVDVAKVDRVLRETGLTRETANDIYYLTSLAKFDDRFVIPAAHREQAIDMLEFAGDTKGSTGFGFKEGTAKRGL